jgi:hypothetical protein
MRVGSDAFMNYPGLSALDWFRLAIDNDGMNVSGRVQNGVVVLEGGLSLPEGTKVTVSCDIAPVSPQRRKKKRVEFPLVHSKHPGTLHLTGQPIAEILDEEDGSLRH